MFCFGIKISPSLNVPFQKVSSKSQIISFITPKFMQNSSPETNIHPPPVALSTRKPKKLTYLKCTAKLKVDNERWYVTMISYINLTS